MCIELEPCYKIKNTQEGVYLEVKVDDECDTLLTLWSADKASEDFYGPFSLTMTADHARKVAKALNGMADFIEDAAFVL